MTQKEFRNFILAIDDALVFFRKQFNEAVKNGDENQIAYYQGCIDSLEWLKKDRGFGKRQN